MGVLHGYYVTEHRIICRDGAKGDTQPTLRGGCQRIQSYQRTGGGLVDGDDGVLHGYDIGKCIGIRTVCTCEMLTPSTILGAYWRI